MQNLADEFGVSRQTIQRDIALLEKDYPLVITRGNGGGVSFPEGYYLAQRHLNPKQVQAIKNVMNHAESSDREILQSILIEFAWPT